MSLRPLFPILESWLTDRCRRADAIAATDSYALWVFTHSALGEGTLELVDEPDLSQSTPVVVMALTLDLPPIRSAQDALTLLQAAEWLDNATVVSKDFGQGEGALMLQAKRPAAQLSPASLDALLRHLADGKHFLA